MQVTELLRPADMALLREATGRSGADLLRGLRAAPARVLRAVLSEDRFVPSLELNRLGLHLLRCLLSERIAVALRKHDRRLERRRTPTINIFKIVFSNKMREQESCWENVEKSRFGPKS